MFEVTMTSLHFVVLQATLIKSDYRPNGQIHTKSIGSHSKNPVTAQCSAIQERVINDTTSIYLHLKYATCDSSARVLD